MIKKTNTKTIKFNRKYNEKPNRKSNKQTSINKNIFKRNITFQEITYFTRQMAIMTSAGIAIIPAFDMILASASNPVVKNLILALKRQVENGATLAQAFQEHPKVFNSFYCTVIYAGELSGTLDDMFLRLANYYEKTNILKNKIKKSLYYPASVLLISFFVTSFLLVKVVPTFQQMFIEFGAELPIATQCVLNLSNILQQYYLFFVFLFITGIFVFRYCYRKYPSFFFLVNRISLNIPLLGSILHKTALARFARTLCTLTEAGIVLSEGLECAAKATGNCIYEKSIACVKEGLLAGNSFSMMLKKVKLFPPLFMQLVHIGEGSGSLDAMLGKIAALYEEEIDTQIDGLTKLIEPIMMIILSFIVGGIMLAMYLPIFQMGQIL